MSPHFVARERELGRLGQYLNHAVAGHGQVVFVAGEAGSGKTALLREFGRRAEAGYADVVVAVGECNAQTGIGDPYLPLREILNQLSGDVDAKLAQGAISQQGAERLRALVGVSAEALVELGPSLINLFVPGSSLLTQAGRYAAKKAGWLKPLQQLSERKPSAGGDSSLDQNRIFEQYTNVLKAIAARQPLLLLVDDLHWADAASISLLFHLGRRLGDSRILIAGSYRPSEVALGRGGERHPLEKVLAELKRYGGDIAIDLSQAEQDEGRRFVDALLDSEPNDLGVPFREALYSQTGGQALFTVELLHMLEERGDLRKDEEGRWVEGPSLDWTALPARVEGVIEERICRLEDSLRETLRVASVEGRDFTAEVVARVQDMRELQLLRSLSEELERKHRLVHERGEIKLSHHVISRFQFAHALFQRYVYNDLGAAQKRLLHGEVARVLEELYAGRLDDVTVQLARHYAEAGEDDKAIAYLLKAGDRARALYANQEAIGHYQRALALVEGAGPGALPAQGDVLAHLYEGLGDVLQVTGQYDQARAAYQHALASAPSQAIVVQARQQRKMGTTYCVQRQYGDALHAFDGAEVLLGQEPRDNAGAWWQEWVQIQLERHMVYYWLNRVEDMAQVVEKVRRVLEQYASPAQRVGFYLDLVLLAIRRDRYVVSDETLAFAHAAAAASLDLASVGERAWPLFMHGFIHLWHGDLDEAEKQLLETLHLAERVGDVVLQSRCLTYLAVICRKRGQIEETRSYVRRCVAVAEEGQMLEYIAAARANEAWLAWREGDLAAAREKAAAAVTMWQKLLLVYPLQWQARWPLISVALAQGELAEAIEHSRGLLAPSQAALPPALTQEMEAATKAWEDGETDNARTHLSLAVELARKAGWA